MRAYERKQRRMNARRLKRSKEAVSPVIATLLLILIAVAAAAALYLWISGWQNSASGKVGSPTSQESIAIGGSTTLYPVTQQAIPWFEQNQSGVTVTDSQGGSGAGLLALCAGQIDIAAMSRPVSSSDPTQCANNVVQTIVGYDAAILLVPAQNEHGLVSLSSQEALTIYWQNGGQPVLSVGSSSNPTLGTTATAKAGSVIAGTASSEYVPAYWGLKAPAGTGATFEWANIPQHACFDPTMGAANLTVVGGVDYYAPSVYSGPCASVWTYDSSSAAADSVHVYARYDNSGTEEAFDNNMIGIKCGTDNQLDTCNFGVNTASTPVANEVNEYVGNPAVLTAIAKDPDALGINSWGLSLAPTSQGGGSAYSGGTTGSGGCSSGGASVCIVSFLGAAVFSSSGTGGVNNGLVPTLSNIITGVQAGYGNEVSTGYVGWRPLQYVTYGQPTGEELRFIEFVTAPGTNVQLMNANFFISYTVVPVNTPPPA